MHQIYQNFESLYNILHILTQLIQTSCLVNYFGMQVFFKVPFTNTFRTQKNNIVPKNFFIFFIYLTLPQGQGHHNSASQLLWAHITKPTLSTFPCGRKLEYSQQGWIQYDLVGGCSASSGMTYHRYNVYFIMSLIFLCFIMKIAPPCTLPGQG